MGFGGDMRRKESLIKLNINGDNINKHITETGWKSMGWINMIP
jgi:hypothetical protein